MDFFVGKLAEAGARLLGTSLDRLFGPGHEVDVPLTDDLMAKISVVPTVGALAASTRDVIAESVFVEVVDDVPLTIHDSTVAQLSVARHMMRRCRCHAHENELGRVWVFPGIDVNGNMTSETFVRELVKTSLRVFGPNNDRLLYVLDDLYICLPFLCLVYYDNVLDAPTRMSDSLALPARGIAYFVETDGIGCRLPYGESHNIDLAATERDAMGVYHPPEATHKAYLRVNATNCHVCDPGCVHGFTNNFFNNKQTVDRRWSAARGIIHSCIALNKLWIENGCPARIQLTAWSSNYGPFSSACIFGWPVFVFVLNRGDRDEVAASGCIPVLVDITSTGTHWLANIRVFAACAMPVGVLVHVTNYFQYTAWVLDLTVDPVAPIECHGASIRNPIVNSVFITSGAVNLGLSSPITVISRFSGIYGLEEACLARVPGAVIRVDHTWNEWGHERVLYPGMLRQHPLVARSIVTGKFAVARGGSRGHLVPFVRIIRRWMRRTEKNTSWTSAWNMPLGAWTDPGPIQIEAAPALPRVEPGRAISLGSAISANIGVVNWFVFGSYGDVVPVLALARRLKGFGIAVHVIRTHTEETGFAILRHAENGNLFKAAPEFMRTMSVAATAPGIVFGPPEFSSVDLGISLRPPPSVIHPADFGAGHLVNFFIEALLRGWAPIMNIGAYHGIDWLPRSADGVNFLKQIVGGNRPVDIMLAWGSSTLPKPVMPGAVETLPGDHVAQFSTAKYVVCHGGAGTVQTAAACGARVISATDILDRRYRDTLDAGRGVKPGSDPDGVMLCLLHLTPLVWIWAWKHSYRMFFRACRLGLRWLIAPALWVVLALSVRSIVFVLTIPEIEIVFTLSFFSTLVATLIMPVVGSWWAIFLGPQIESLVLFLLHHAGLTYSAALMTLIQFLAGVSRNPVMWGLVVAGHAWAALPIAWMTAYFQLIPLLTTELLTVLIGAPVATDDSGYTKVGISWAWPHSNIPAFHTRFISPDETQSVEGHWVAGSRALGALYSIRLGPLVDDIPNEWRFSTRMPWSVLANVKPVTAPYSPLWNCQSGMLYVSRGCWVLLGISLVVLMPMGIWMLLCLILITTLVVIVSILVEIVPVLTLIMIAAGHGRRVALVSDWLSHHLSALVESETGWFPMAVTTLVGISTGWGGEHEKQPLLAEIFMAEDLPTLMAIQHKNLYRITKLENVMISMKMQHLKFVERDVVIDQREIIPIHQIYPKLGFDVPASYYVKRVLHSKIPYEFYGYDLFEWVVSWFIPTDLPAYL